MTTFRLVQLQGVTINLKSGEIKITLSVILNDDNLAKAQKLSPFIDPNHGSVILQITPTQLPLKEDL